jgi:integrase/recombinase XerC
MSIEKFIEYLRVEKAYSPHTCQSYETDLSRYEDFIRHELNADLRNAGKEEIRAWILNLIESGYSPGSINRKISALKTFYRFMQRVGDVKENPATTIKSLKKPKRYVLPFSEKEIREVLSVISHEGDDYPAQRDRMVIELLYTTGMRRSELIALKKKDIDFAAQSIKVQGKRDKQRIIPLLEETAQLLKKHIELLNRLFPSTEYIITNNKGEKAGVSLIYNIVKRRFTGISTKSKISPHVLRHSFATHLLDEGAGLQEVKELLGHEGLSSTQVYTHTSLQRLKDAYKKAHPRNKK